MGRRSNVELLIDTLYSIGKGPMKITDLIEDTGCNHGSVSTLVDGMEERGLVDKAGDVFDFYILTDYGKEMLSFHEREGGVALLLNPEYRSVLREIAGGRRGEYEIKADILREMTKVKRDFKFKGMGAGSIEGCLSTNILHRTNMSGKNFPVYLNELVEDGYIEVLEGLELKDRKVKRLYRLTEKGEGVLARSRISLNNHYKP